MLVVAHRPTQMFLGLVVSVGALGFLVTDLVWLHREYSDQTRTDFMGVATSQSSVGIGLWLAFGLLVFLTLFHLVAFGRFLRRPKSAANQLLSDLG